MALMTHPDPEIVRLTEEFIAGLEASINPDMEKESLKDTPRRNFSMTLHDPAAVTTTPEYRDFLIKVLTECGLTKITLNTLPTKGPRKPHSPFKFTRRRGRTLWYLCSVVGPLSDIWLLLRGANAKHQAALTTYEEQRSKYDPYGWDVIVSYEYNHYLQTQSP